MLDTFNFGKKRNLECKVGYESFCKKCNGFTKSRREKGGSMTSKEFGDWIASQNPACFYCSITPSEIEKIKHTHIFWGNYGGLTIDRTDSTKGYDKDNLVLACMRCNRIKSNIFTYDEMVIIGKMLRNKNPRKGN